MTRTKGKWTVFVFDASESRNVITYVHATEFSIHEVSPWYSFVDEKGTSHLTSLPVHAISETAP